MPRSKVLLSQSFISTALLRIFEDKVSVPRLSVMFPFPLTFKRQKVIVSDGPAVPCRLRPKLPDETTRSSVFRLGVS